MANTRLNHVFAMSSCNMSPRFVRISDMLPSCVLGIAASLELRVEIFAWEGELSAGKAQRATISLLLAAPRARRHEQQIQLPSGNRSRNRQQPRQLGSGFCECAAGGNDDDGFADGSGDCAKVRRIG